MVLQRSLGRLTRWMSSLSLVRKLTLAYAGFLLIPTLAVGVYTYQSAQRSVRNELLQSHIQTLTHVRENLDARVQALRTTADSIAFNMRLQDFLLLEFAMLSHSLEHYNQQIMPIVSYALNYSAQHVRRISVYMANTTIPEIWNTFYWESRIEDAPWYGEFMARSTNHAWIYPHRSDHFARRTPVDSVPVLTWVQRITAGSGRHLGLVTMDVHESVLFSAIDSANSQGARVVLADDEGRIVYGPGTGTVLPHAHLVHGPPYDTSGLPMTGESLHLAADTALDGLRMVLRVPLREMLAHSRVSGVETLAAFLIGGILIIVLLHVALRLVFGKMGQILSVMHTVAGGDFSIRVPVDRGDELGVLASDFNALIERINALVVQLVEKDRSQRDAQLLALQYQINPHFIYNTIDAFRMKMVLHGSYETAEAITDFGKMLRYNMSNQAVYATVEEEVRHVESYVNLQRFRFGDRLEYASSVEGVPGTALIIKFVLQPIVENSFTHRDLARRDGPIRITLSATADTDSMSFVVEDNGPGIDPVRLEELNRRLGSGDAPSADAGSSESIGLFNINRRIRLFYGERYSVCLQSVRGEFTRTQIRIPYLAGGGAADVPSTRSG